MTSRRLLRSIRAAATIKGVARALSTEKQPLKLTPVQTTSLLTAFWRNIETKRTDREPLIRDEPAGTLVSALLPPEREDEWASSPLLHAGVDALAVRSRAIDNWLEGHRRSACKGSTSEKDGEPTTRQVVNLGAGMCSRPYRLDLRLPGTTIQWFEVDDPSLLAAKRLVLEGIAGLVPMVGPPSVILDVPGDVLDVEILSESLLSAGLDPEVPTDWILEGLLEYLDPSSDHGPIFDMAREMGGAQGSRIMVQVLEPATVRYLDSIGVSLPYRDLVSTDYVRQTLQRCGWGDARVQREIDFVKAFGRSPTVPGFCLVDAVAL